MAGQLRFQCPGCQAMLQVKEELRGETISCPKCQRRLRLPEAPIQAAPKEDANPFDHLPDLPVPASSPPPLPSQDASFWDTSKFATSAPSQYPSSGAGRYQTSARGSARYQVPEDREMTDADQNTQSTGIFLVVVPILAAILPLFGLQLRRLARAGEFAPLGAMILGFIGAGIIVYARRGRRDAAVAGIVAVMTTLVFGVGGFLLQANNVEDGEFAEEPPSRRSRAPMNSPIVQPRNLQGDPLPQVDLKNDHQQFVEEQRRQNEEFLKRVEDERRRQNAEMENQRLEMQKRIGKDREEFIRQMRENQPDSSPGFPSRPPRDPTKDIPRFDR